MSNHSRSTCLACGIEDCEGRCPSGLRKQAERIRRNELNKAKYKAITKKYPELTSSDFGEDESGLFKRIDIEALYSVLKRLDPDL